MIRCVSGNDHEMPAVRAMILMLRRRGGVVFVRCATRVLVNTCGHRRLLSCGSAASAEHSGDHDEHGREAGDHSLIPPHHRVTIVGWGAIKSKRADPCTNDPS